jgi:thymidylate synthase
MIRTIEAITADAAWLAIADIFRRKDGTEIRSSRLGQVHEILHTAITIQQPTDRWVLSREPAINPAFALAEVIWILTGRNDASFLNYFNRALPSFAGRGPSYHGAYGFRLRRHFEDAQNRGLDQLERAYLTLSHQPDSRQAILQIWDCRVDLPDPLGAPSAEDIPCNVLAMLKVREGTLHWTQVVRSNDLFRGFPYNLVQFTMLYEVIAGWLGLNMAPYHLLIDSLHLYEDTWAAIERSVPLQLLPSNDNLGLARNESDAAFDQLASLGERIADDRSTIPAIREWARKSMLPPGHRNILVVLAAEGVRRRGNLDAAYEMLDECNNHLYRQLCLRWFQRVSAQIGRDAPR